MQEYIYESDYATLSISAENEDDADQILADLVREPNIFDLTHIGAV